MTSTRGVYESALDLFTVGIGPSSSHTVGPMRAAAMFRSEVEDRRLRVTRYEVILYGSLAATGVGHGTPDAVIAGLRGWLPERADPRQVHGRWAEIVAGAELSIDSVRVSLADVRFERILPEPMHPNSLKLRAHCADGIGHEATFASVGGGFVERVGKRAPAERPARVSSYRNAAELLLDVGTGSIADLAWADEVAQHGAAAAGEGLDRISAAMNDCIDAGLRAEGLLPGGLRVPRRAAHAHRTVLASPDPDDRGTLLSVYALAVNEENAAGGRVVTAPTNGAAGIIPAVMRFALGQDSPAGSRTFLLTAAAIGSIIKANASISGAVGGCQAEVGSACAMAAGALTAIRGGTPAQVENAAEIALEHHLGLTCDPVGGLVQIPCIERNAIAATTAFTASRLALLGAGTHVVSLDTVIEVMRQTGEDMSTRYKETSAAGLAVNVVEC